MYFDFALQFVFWLIVKITIYSKHERDTPFLKYYILDADELWQPAVDRYLDFKKIGYFD